MPRSIGSVHRRIEPLPGRTLLQRTFPGMIPAVVHSSAPRPSPRPKARAAGLVLAMLLVHGGFAQAWRVAGTVADDADGGTLPGASVLLIDAADSTQRRSTVTDADGAFHFAGVPAGNYRLRSGFVGYADLQRPLEVAADVAGIVLRLKVANTELKPVELVVTQARAEQKGDTTIFNAGAFKVNPDASAEDLVTKMPGITNDGGTIKAQGEAVKRVLVDGEEFFGDDANIALKNLPAEVIDKVQVFDRLSDQAQFTGFDDGNREKTLNIVTKNGRNQGVFGKAGVGYGTDERYLATLSLNWFQGARRITLLGQSNNVNQQNFSAQDLVGLSSGGSMGGRGGGGRGGPGGAGGGNFLVGAQPGINTTNAIGLNYSDKFGKAAKFTGSYFFNQQQGVNTALSDRTTFLSDTSAQLTTSSSDRTSDNFNHRLTFRLETTLDSANSIILTPRLGLQRNTSTSLQASAVTDAEGDRLSASDNDGRNRRDGLDLSNSLLFRHRFALRGRTFSANLSTAVTGQDSRGTLLAHNAFRTDTSTVATTIDQRSDGENRTQRHGLDLNYTEPMGRKGQLQLAVSPSIQLSDAEKLTYDIDPDDGGELLNTRLSNRAENTIRTLRGGVSFRTRGDTLSFAIGLDGQGTGMHSEQTYPYAVTVDRAFANLLPNAMLMRKWGKDTRLRIYYRTSTRTPTIAQLQSVVDNSDPLKLTTGDLGLDQSYQHALSFNFNTLDSTRTRPFFAMLALQAEQGRISSVTYAPARDSTLADGTVLPAGAQLTRPANLDGYVLARTLVNYGFPLTALKSNMNLTAGGSLERLPGAVNGITSFTRNTNWNVGGVVSSNISKGVDFRVGYTANFNTARSDLNSTLDNDYYQGRLTGKLTLNGAGGWVLENEVNYDQYIGLGAGFDQDVLVWNAALGHKFLRNDALELRVTAYDLLGRNVSVTREVGDTYFQTTVTNMLQRYVLFTLSFNLRAFKGMREEAAPAGPPGMPRGGWERPGGGPPPGP